MRINPYLSFDGQCKTAFKFYAQCLNGKIEVMQTFAGTPAAPYAPAGGENKILHARLSVGDDVLMGSDVPAERYDKGKGISVALVFKDVAESERVFHALSENGRVDMAIQPTFWAARFGMLVDQFGVPWMINCEPAAA
jgi:PhnB protein